MNINKLNKEIIISLSLGNILWRNINPYPKDIDKNKYFDGDSALCIMYYLQKYKNCTPFWSRRQNSCLSVFCLNSGIFYEYKNVKSNEKIKFNQLENWETLEFIVQKLKNKVQIVETNNICKYNYKERKIYIPNKNKFISDVAYYDSLFHECCHWSEEYLNLSKLPLLIKELRAEIAASFLLNYIGLSCLPNSIPYRANIDKYLTKWIILMSYKPTLIFDVANLAYDFIKFTFQECKI